MKSSSEPKTVSAMLGQHLQAGVMIAGISLGALAIAGFLGSWLDEKFSTFPLFIIILILISFPIAQLATYRWIKDHYLPKHKKLPS